MAHRQHEDFLNRCFNKGISPAAAAAHHHHLTMRNYPLFQIKYTPKARCKVHQALQNKILEHEKRAMAIRQAQE